MIENFDSTPDISAKLRPKFKVPCEIVREVKNNRFALADIDGFQLTQRRYEEVWEVAKITFIVKIGSVRSYVSRPRTDVQSGRQSCKTIECCHRIIIITN